MRGESASQNNYAALEEIKLAYDSELDHIVKGCIVSSRINWYENGEKNNKFFLNLENHNHKKNWIRKIHTQNNDLTTSPREIMNELEYFYTDLYKDTVEDDPLIANTFLDNTDTPRLNEQQKTKNDGKLTTLECFNALKTFNKNKSPGNDGLNAEFYQFFWPFFGEIISRSA